MKSCPNKNDKDWIKLVSLIGEEGAYRAYILNDEEIPNPIDYLNYINYSLKAAVALNSDKVREPKVGNDQGFFNDLKKLGVPDTQIELIKFNGIEGKTKEDIKEDLLLNNTHAVTIDSVLSPVYSYLTVPGGTNYTETQIVTPNITPVLQGHPSFATPNAIGWFRADEEASELTLEEEGIEVDPDLEHLITPVKGSSVRRILEIQSDLFQKKREETSLAKGPYSDQNLVIIKITDKDLISRNNGNPYYVIADKKYENNQQDANTFFVGSYFDETSAKQGLNKTLKQEGSLNFNLDNANSFLQLLNKDNDWVSFFVRSIIQDSARKGYTTALFPVGLTASKIEKHETAEDFIARKTERLNDLERDIAKVNSGEDIKIGAYTYSSKNGYTRTSKNTSYTYTQEEYDKKMKLHLKDLEREARQLKREINNVQTNGIATFKAIHNFYENTLGNTLKKLHKSTKRITDSNGNSWFEVPLSDEKVLLDLTPDNPEAIYQDLVIPGFSAYLQDETVNHIMEQVLADIRDNPGISFNKAISNFILLAEDEILEGNNKYEPIVENIDRFRMLVKDRLDRIGLLDRNTIDPDDAIQAGGDDANDGFYWEDDWVFKYNAKLNAQKSIKRFLTFIPKTTFENGEFKDVTNYLDTFSFVPFDEIFEDLKAILADTPNNWEAMRSQLEDIEQTKPWVYNLLYQIDNYTEDRERLLNQFVSTFSSTYNNFKTILWDKKRGDFSFRIIETDQNSVINTLLSKWKNEFNTTDLYKEDSNGDLIPNTEVVEEVIKQIDNLQTNPKDIRKVLSRLGINISEGTAEELVKSTIGSLTYKQQFTSTRGLFNLIKTRLKGGDTEGLEAEEIINPVINNSAVRYLAYTEHKYNPALYSNSTRNGEGNTVYSYSFNKYFTYQFSRLRDVDYLNSLQKLTFHAPIMDGDNPIYKTWLYELVNNSQFKDIFEVSPFDTLKKSSRDGVPLGSMTDVDLEVTKLQAFQNRGRQVKGIGSISNYIFTIPSKTTSYMVTAPRIPMNLSFKSNSYQFGKQIKDSLYSIALTELQRINNSFGRSIELTKYKNGSKLFYFFPVLNKDTSPEIWNSDGTVKLPTTKVGDTTVEAIIRAKVEEIIRNNIDTKIQYWKDIGFIKEGKLLFVDKGYAKSLKLNNDANNIIAAADYIINNTLFEFNMHQMFVGDPATYYKKDVASTWDEIGKRLAAQIAPGKDLALNSPNEKFISIKVQDREGNTALNIAQLQERLKKEADPYLELNGTDAQEFTTLREALYVEWKLGNIDTTVYNDILDRYKKQKDKFRLTEKELGIVLQPKKPVYVNTRIDSEQDVLDIDYIKSSSIALLPQFTQGLEIDKLRKAMEALEEERGLPVRLAFNSATKVGTIPSTNIFNEDGTIKDGLELKTYKELSREGFRIQQDVPYDETKNEVVKSSQITKLLFDAALGLKNFGYKGSNYDGIQLKAIWNDLHDRLFKLSLADLNNDILDAYGKMNIKKVQQMLVDEATKREYSPAEVASLSLLPDQTFEFPFWAVNSSRKFEAILTSLYTNNIIKQKMPGNSYILVSEEAMKGKSKGIVYTSKYNPETGLQPMRIGENGETLPAQVLIPWRFAANINDFKDIDGNIDFNKLPEELLTQFGFRIPAQSHSSMSLIEVVGFVPPIMGDMVIATRNFVTQMGSDFDVDKLYIYNYATEVVDGKIQRITSDGEEGIKNDIFDIHKSVLKHPEMFNSVVKPLGNLKDTPTGKELKSLYKKNINNYLSPDYKKAKYSESVDGKNMIGITALSTTLNPTLQEFNLSFIYGYDKETKLPIKRFVVIGDEKGKQIELTYLSSPYTWKGNRKNTIQASRLSAAVDNEKDPTLYYVNANDITAPFIGAWEQLGIEEDHIYNITSQPIILEYVRRVRNLQSATSESGNPRALANSTLNWFIKDSLDKYLKTLSEAKQAEFNIGSIFDYPITVAELKKNLKKQDPFINIVILFKFQEGYELGRSLAQIQSGINLESSGIGKSVLELSVKRQRITSLYNIKNLDGITPLLANGYTASLLESGLFAANETLGSSDNQLFKYNSRGFKALLNQFEDITSYTPSTNQVEDMWDNFKSYIFSKQFTLEERKDLFFGKRINEGGIVTSISPSLAMRIKKYIKTKEGATNPFLLRLTFDTMTFPHLVSYNAAKEEYVDEVNIYRGFVELISSTDTTTRKLGEDLVTYFYINGGIQKAREWGKYIHPGYLKQYKEGGFLNYLRNYEFQNIEQLGAEEPAFEFLIQYFQHKPWFTPSLDIGNKDYRLNKEETLLTLPAINSASSSLPVSLNADGEYPAVISINDNRIEKGYKLFVKGNTKEDGTVEFKRIPILGATNFNEYGSGKSLVNKNYEPKVNKPAPVKDAPIEDTKKVSNATNKPKTVGEALDGISNPKWKPLVETLRAANYGDYKINILTERLQGYAEGRHYGANKTIDVYLYAKDFERTLLHEIVHAATSKALRSVDGLTSNQIKAINNLKTLANTIRNKVLNGELESIGLYSSELNTFDTLNKARLTRQLTPDEMKEASRLRPLYYGISLRDDTNEVNYDEFIAELTTHETFQQALSRIPYDSKKTFLDRIIELLSDLIKTFGVTTDSALEAALHDVIVVVTDKPSTKVTKNSLIDRARTKNEIHPDAANDSLQEAAGEEYNSLLQRFDSRLRFIDQSIATSITEKDPVRTETLIARRDEVTKELSKFENNAVFSSLLALGKKDLDLVETLLKQAALSHNDINYILRVVKTWQDASELVLTDEDIKDINQRAKDISDLQARAGLLYNKWLQVARTSLLDAIKIESGLDYLTEEVLAAQEKVNALTANLMDISRTGNIVLDVMSKWMREARFKTNIEAKDIHDKTLELADKLKNNELFKKEGYYLFAQRLKSDETDKDELTGEIVRSLSAKYYETRNKLIEDASKEQNEQKRKVLWRNYFDWVKDNHLFVDMRKLYKIDNEGRYIYNPDVTYLEKLKKDSGERYEALLEEQKKKIEYYNERLDSKILSLDKSDPDFTRNIEKWKAANDPSIYLRSILDNSYAKQKIAGEYIKNDGQEYVVKRAFKKWQDDQYTKIQEDTDLKAFYDHMVGTMNNLYKMLPSGFKEKAEVNNYTIPSINKAIIEEYSERGMAAALSGASDNIIEKLSVSGLDNQTNKLQDPITNKPLQSLRVRYLNTLTPDERSYDLAKVVNMFAVEALNFKHKSMVEDSIRLSQSILEQSLEVVRSPSGQQMLDRFGKNLTVKDGKNLQDQMEHAIATFYGNGKNLQAVTSKKVYTKGANKKNKAYQDFLTTGKYTKELNDFISNDLRLPKKAKQLSEGNQLDEKEGEQLNLAVAQFLQKNTRNVAGSKIGDVLLQYMQLKGMGWNIFSSATNVTFGWFSNFIHASGEADFNNEQLLKANKMMLSATGRSFGVDSTLGKKINALMVKFDVLKELNDGNFESTTNTNRIKRGVNNMSPFELQRKGEYFVQGMTLLARMLNTNVTLADGKTVNLFEAFDNEGNFVDKGNINWSFNPNDKKSGKEFFSFKFRLDQINKGIHGNYDPSSPVRIKSGILGRATMQFRSWIAEGVANRVEGRKYDLFLGREREGRWRTYGKLGFSESLKTLAKLAAGKKLDNYNEVDLKLITENMKRNLAELYQTLALMSLYFVLKQIELDDDDEWGKRAANFTLNQILRLQDDIEFYYSPLAVENITQNFVPVFTLVRDGWKFKDAIEKGVIDGEWEYKTGKKAGENRVLWTGAKVFPFGSSVASFLNKTETEEGFRK